jgi:hypothetical protein
LRLALLIVIPGLLAAQAPKVGSIDYYGFRKVPRAKVDQVLGIKPGGRLPPSKADAEERIEEIPGVLRAHIAAVCCDNGAAIVYVGIEEKGAPAFDFHDPPRGEVRVPEEIHEAYYAFLGALDKAVRAGEAAEDLSRGHSLMKNTAAREAQERFVELADKHLDVLRQVLRESANEEHRAIAAYVIGYASKKTAIINDLQYGMRDPDETVRNNAMRALGAIAVLAARQPDEYKFSTTWFVEMLNSVIWSDRNKASIALVNFTENRPASTLQHLRERALDSLIEMANWSHLPHALPAFILLGRVAGLEEKTIQEAWKRGDRDSLIRAAKRRP